MSATVLLILIATKGGLWAGRAHLTTRAVHSPPDDVTPVEVA